MRELNKAVIGQCSLCGGNVCVPMTWFGVIPPPPTCQGCGAVSQPASRVTIPMKRPVAREQGRLTRIYQRVLDGLR